MGVRLQCLTEANPRETTYVFWFEESGVSNNRVFEKSGFPCIPFHIPLESHQFCGPVITEALPMVHCGNAQIRQVREVRTFFGNFFQFAQTREHSFSFEFARHFLNVTHDELRIISSINVSNCQAIVTDYVKTCSEKNIFICLYHNHLNHYLRILVPGEFVFVLPRTNKALLCQEIGLVLKNKAVSKEYRLAPFSDWGKNVVMS